MHWISQGDGSMSASDQPNDPLFFQQSWQHLMGALDRMLDDAQGNAATLTRPEGEIGQLLARAGQERAACEEMLRELVIKREQLAATLDQVQRELAIAGVPLRGEIT